MKKLLLLIISLILVTPSFADPTPVIFGSVEYATFVVKGYTVKAKMDTGAKTSSLDARNIHLYRKNGEQWVTFSVRPQAGKPPLIVKRKVIDFVKILKRAPSRKDRKQREFNRRPVVKMTVCIGTHKHVIKVNLTDRNQFVYPLLLGRSAIKQFGAMINPSKTFLQPKTCQLGDVS